MCLPSGQHTTVKYKGEKSYLFSERTKPQVIHHWMRTRSMWDFPLVTLMLEDNGWASPNSEGKLFCTYNFNPYQTGKYHEGIFFRNPRTRKFTSKIGYLRICCSKVRDELMKSRKKQIPPRGIKKGKTGMKTNPE